MIYELVSGVIIDVPFVIFKMGLIFLATGSIVYLALGGLGIIWKLDKLKSLASFIISISLSVSLVATCLSLLLLLVSWIFP